MAVSEEGRGRRIVDYLNDGEELGVEGAVETTPRSPAAAVAARLSRIKWPRLSGLGRKGGSSGKGKTVLVVAEEEVVAEERDLVPVPVPVPVSASEQSAARNCESASTSGTRQAADLGMGVSLVFLLAKTSDEFNKMVKVRAEMEALLDQFKHQVRETMGGSNGHDVVPEPEPRNQDESTTSSCLTDRNDRSAGAQMEEQAVSSGVEASSCGCRGRRMDDGMEEEFRAEMERLQVTYGSDVPLFVAKEELDSSEPSDDIDDDYRHEGDDDLGQAVEDEDDDDDETEYNGVSAVELERKLHELLHERNRERIEELEAALRRAEKKLAEKELEVSLWKDTAKFALRQENELQ